MVELDTGADRTDTFGSREHKFGSVGHSPGRYSARSGGADLWTGGAGASTEPNGTGIGVVRWGGVAVVDYVALPYDRRVRYGMTSKRRTRALSLTFTYFRYRVCRVGTTPNSPRGHVTDRYYSSHRDHRQHLHTRAARRPPCPRRVAGWRGRLCCTSAASPACGKRSAGRALVCQRAPAAPSPCRVAAASRTKARQPTQPSSLAPAQISGKSPPTAHAAQLGCG